MLCELKLEHTDLFLTILANKIGSEEHVCVEDAEALKKAVENIDLPNSYYKLKVFADIVRASLSVGNIEDALAGAENMIVSLWEVEEESTAILMDYFYGYLKKGMAADLALGKAKRDLIRYQGGIYSSRPQRRQRRLCCQKLVSMI